MHPIPRRPSLPAPLRVAALAISLAGGLLLAPIGAPGAVAVGPLPTCRLTDILTVPRGYDDWQFTLVDWILSLGRDYAPPDLVPLGNAGVTGGGSVRKVAMDDLRAMADAARADGVPLGNVSAYRSYRQQKRLFNDYVNAYGYDKAITFSARPGHSEHQLGLTIDFADAGGSSFVSEEAGAGRWLSRNAWKYGWLMSYPKGKRDVACYRYEPWHYRYVGRELAEKIRKSGLTIREYLWASYTMVDPGTGQPLPGASPTPPSSAEPSAAPPSDRGTLPPFTPAPGATGGPGGTAPPTSPAGAFLGLDPAAAIAGLLLLVLVVALAASVSRWRRARQP